jgi:NADH:ubiquinone oxidoreductase subunit D
MSWEHHEELGLSSAGDLWMRWFVRLMEMRADGQSLRILELAQLPALGDMPVSSSAELRRCRHGASMKLLEEAMHPGLIGPAGVRLPLQ